MKKLNLLFIAMIGLVPAKIGAGQIDYSWDIDQEAAKESTFFKDGNSFAQAEENFRKKYAHVNIPPIVLFNSITNHLTGAELGMDAAYDSESHRILSGRKTVSQTNEKSFEWAMLHETGHAQYPYVIPSIRGSISVTQLLTAYFWGMHKKKPYKNFVTKYGSKSVAGLSMGALFACTALKAEERRADSYANKHGDAQALQGGIEYLNEAKHNTYPKVWAESNLSSVLPYSVGKYVIDLTHPLIDGRIAKCKKALKTRFGIDA